MQSYSGIAEKLFLLAPDLKKVLTAYFAIAKEVNNLLRPFALKYYNLMMEKFYRKFYLAN